MRSTTCMNDFSEVQHGHLLLRAWHGNSGKDFKVALDKCHPGVTSEIEQEFDKQTPAIMNGSFVACFSEHDPKEDRYGRLSMWRAYSSAGTGVAMVLNPGPFFQRSDALKAYSSPVAYLDDREFAEAIEQIAANVDKERDLLGSFNRQFLRDVVLNVLRFAILCTKHPAFEEEQEWRIVYTPALFESTHVRRNVRVIRGVAQPVYDLPLKNIPEEGLTGITIPELVHKIIVGPTQYGPAVASALMHLLNDAGVAEPNKRILVSNVPLRT